ncbi:MAG: SDR family NAD(P)-dependent oxidoreductase [Fimbriimonas sp.]
MGKLNGKVAVVTGGSRGIGAAIAKRLGSEGASVVVNYSRSQASADAVVEEICAEGGRAVAIGADVTQEAEVRALLDRTVEEFGPIDLLVNNAGIAEFGPLSDADSAQIQRQFDVNVTALWNVTREAVNRFRPAGGSVVNISSTVGRQPLANGVPYSATKAAVDAVTVGLARELGTRGIRVNSVAPGPVETDMFQSLVSEENVAHFLTRMPLGRIGQPEDVAGAVAFLVSDDASWITAQVLGVDGGINP